MRRIPHTEFLDRLERLGVLSHDDRLAVASMLDQEPTLLVSEAVRDVRHLDWDRFIALLCEEFGSEHVDPELLRRWPLQAEALKLVSSATAHDQGIFPLSFDPRKRRLLVLTAYPFNPHMLRDLPADLPVDDVELTFCREDVLADLLRRGYVGEASLVDQDRDGGFDIGALTDEEAFPGIYGDSVAKVLYGDDMAPAEGGPAKPSPRSEGEGVRGSLSHLSVVDMLQALGQSRKTCSIYLESGEWRGEMHLDEGWVVHAQTAKRQAEDAVYEILGITTGHFEIVQRAYDGERSMYAGVEGLLLEGMRRLDESQR